MKTRILLLLPFLGVLFFTSCSPEEEDDTTVSELAAEGKTIQQMLDLGKTPYDIYQHDNTWLDTLYGLTYQGGLIYYLDVNSGEGYVVLDSNIGNKPEWGCYATTITGADGGVVGNGQQNTADILTGCTTANTAADVCDDLVYGGYSDWFLPSTGSLQYMNSNLNNKGLGDFGSLYWSSTEASANSAYGFSFVDGTTSSHTKISTLFVRAVRKF